VIATAAQAKRRLASVGAMTLTQLAAEIAGEPIKGSWWGHRAGKQIFKIATALEASSDVVVAKLIDGRVTFLHRRHAPALIRVVTDPSWREGRVKGLLPSARALLAKVERKGTVRCTDKPYVRQPLETRALVHAASEHTDAGHHATVLTSWATWAKRALGRAKPTQTVAAARAELAAIGVEL
jgi:hypothetical protein